MKQWKMDIKDQTSLLKSCPWCGGQGKICDLSNFPFPGRRFKAICLVCNATRDIWFDTVEEAVNVWNFRAS